MLYVLKLFPLHPSNRSGLVVSVLDWVFWIVGSNLTAFHIIFFFQIEETCTFQLGISSKCDIKAENSSTLCKFHEGRKGLRLLESNA